MNIDKVNLARIWYESEDGTKRVVNKYVEEVDIAKPSVDEYPITFARFPLTIKTEVYRRRPDGGYGTKDRILTAEAGAAEDLVLALATGANEGPQFSLHDALVITSEACERCMNALAHEYGLGWGYPEFGGEWRECGTSCVMCEDC